MEWLYASSMNKYEYVGGKETLTALTKLYDMRGNVHDKTYANM